MGFRLFLQFRSAAAPNTPRMCLQRRSELCPIRSQKPTPIPDCQLAGVLRAKLSLLRGQPESWLLRGCPALHEYFAHGFRCRPSRITVGVPCFGMWAREVSMMCVRSQPGMYRSTSFLPNSRFMNEFAVIMPTKPLHPARRLKKRSMKGTASEYWRWQEPKRFRYSEFRDLSLTAMYGGLPTTA